MEDYQLRSDEQIVYRCSSVLHSKWMEGSSHELVLTSENLIVVNRGFFGAVKGDTVFPLRDIEIFDGQVQAVPTRKSNLSYLDIYFKDRPRQFIFQDRREAKFLAEKINQVITGTPASRNTLDTSATAKVADTVKDTVDTFKKAFGFGVAAPAAAVAHRPLTVAGDCVSCGAPISGKQGRATICSYCDTPTQL